SCGHWKCQNPSEEFQDGFDEFGGLALTVAAEPGQVQSIGVELVLPTDGHERGWAGGFFDCIQGLVQGVDKGSVKAIFSALHAKNENIALLFQIHDTH